MKRHKACIVPTYPRPPPTNAGTAPGLHSAQARSRLFLPPAPTLVTQRPTSTPHDGSPSRSLATKSSFHQAPNKPSSWQASVNPSSQLGSFSGEGRPKRRLAMLELPDFEWSTSPVPQKRSRASSISTGCRAASLRQKHLENTVLFKSSSMSCLTLMGLKPPAEPKEV